MAWQQWCSSLFVIWVYLPAYTLASGEEREQGVQGNLVAFGIGALVEGGTWMSVDAALVETYLDTNLLFN